MKAPLLVCWLCQDDVLETEFQNLHLALLMAFINLQQEEALQFLDTLDKGDAQPSASEEINMMSSSL